MFSGVLIRRSSPPQKIAPNSIKTPHSTPPAISDVYTLVFISPYFFAPKKLDTTTEQPILQPNANAMKINVIS